MGHRADTIRLGVVVVMASTMMLAGCSGAKDHRNEGETDSEAAEITNLGEETTARMDTAVGEAGIVGTIKDAIASQRVVKCSYLSDGELFYMYLKGNRAGLESETQIDGKPVSYQGVIVDETYYIWEKTETKGLKLDLKQPKGNPVEVNDQPVYSLDEVISQLEGSKQTCTMASPADSIFEIPANIQFVEM